MDKPDLATSNPGPTDGATHSTWLDSAPPPELRTLEHDLRCDVCVVGAGIAGLTTAYLLAREGRDVVVLEQGTGVGAGQSGRTTAHFTAALDDRYYALERLHGRRGAGLAADSHSRAIDEVERLIAEEAIACDFSRLDGYLFAAPGRPDGELAREFAACQRAGLDVRQVARAPLPFDSGPCLRFPRQAQLHPMQYLAGLARGFEHRGGHLYGRAHVTSIKGGAPARITVGAFTVVAGAVVVATNVPINDMVVIHTKQAPYRTYVIACRVRPGSVAPALYWDTGDPYHYLRLQGDDLLIVGGEDHKTGQFGDAQPEQRWQRLEEWTRERFAIEGIAARWSGQVLEPIDGLGYIGANPMDEANVFIATGDSGNGMTHGTIAGMLLSDLVRGRDNKWEALYDPARKSLRSAGRFVRENANVARQYVDWLERGDVASADDIEPGQGAVVRRGLHMVAVYVAEDGQRTECSAACTHLGCIVRWNGAEKSWDCPCHGSRFDAVGHVIEGPATGDLAHYAPGEAEVPEEVTDEEPTRPMVPAQPSPQS